MEFRILGAFEVWNAGRELAVGKGRQRTLLALLTVRRNESVSVAQLLDELWPAGAPPTARTSLHRYISQLRKVLGRDRLQTTSNGYELRIDDRELDSQRFVSTLASGHASAALKLWRGPALAEWDGLDFAMSEIERLAALRLVAIEQRVDALIGRGKYAEAAAELEGETREHPFRERFRYLQMLALYGSGSQGAALEVYARTRRALLDELGLEPSTELVDLHQRILNQDPSLLSTRQITNERADPPTALRDARAPWPFTAREEEFSVLKSAIVRGNERPGAPSGAVVYGQPGVGKTRLIQEAVAWAQDQQMHTAWAIGTRSARQTPYAALAHLTPELSAASFEDPAGLYRAFAAALLGADRRRFVLAIDDAHLLDPGSAALVLHIALAGAATVIASVRRGEPTPDPITTLWKDGLALRVDLQPFSPEETDTLVSTALGGRFSAQASLRLASGSRGNALYIREMILGSTASGGLRQHDGIWVWDGPTDLPPRLVDAVSERLEGLSSVDRHALAIIALGEPLPITVIEQIIPPAAIARIEAAGLAQLHDEGGEINCRLAHPLYGDVTLAQLGAAERRRLLRILSDALTEFGRRTDQDRMRIATWRLDAGAHVSAGYLTQAAIIANHAFDYRLGERLAQAAADRAGGPAAAVALAQSLSGQQKFTAAESILAASETQILAAPDHALQHSYLTERFNALYQGLAQRAPTLSMLDRFAAQHSDRESRYFVDGYRAAIVLDDGRMPDVLTLTAAALNDPDASPAATYLAARLTGEAAVYLGQMALAESARDRLRLLAATRAPEAAAAQTTADLQANMRHILEGRALVMEPVLTAYMRKVGDNQDKMGLGLTGLELGTTLLMRGKPLSARDVLVEAIEAFQQMNIGGVLQWAHAILAQAYALVGDLSAAKKARLAADAGPTTPMSIRTEVDFTAADVLIEMADGNVTGAIRLALDGAARLEHLIMHQARLLHLAFRLGAPSSAVREKLATIASQTDAELALILRSHVDAAAQHDAEALEATAGSYESLGLTLHAAEAAAQAAAAYRKIKALPAAARIAARTDSLLAQCEGARTPLVAAPATHSTLSRREYEVARLAATGLSNAAIATRLVLSVRTVESHLYQAFGKLGVETRADLAAALPEIPVPRAQ
ncbi:DNA-binding SARP family transcriptional activator [Antricoccus suffuscus]|uniref:DNA-binding SARP family transcriptional activator n=1 Tax=Antricoccus suffuscus TaxID=1629062 RepID=A0A2T0ZXW4_9ACTN|nr:BTAD domain-containing putative transcriptional regulator [Antricoccus suffuscus]PRZ41195.1 DNA-binding SARP family transcriptional activator [Antricoccus suffuscus]